MNQCPYCQATENQIKAGRTKAGSQRFRCKLCQRRYTPEPKERGYPEGMRQQAVRLYADGMNLRRIARQLGVNHQTAANWINAYADRLPGEPPLPERECLMLRLYDCLRSY
jgi:transposase-like protein